MIFVLFLNSRIARYIYSERIGDLNKRASLSFSAINKNKFSKIYVSLANDN